MKTEKTYQLHQRSRMPVLLAILLIVLAVAGWHLLAPVLGFSFALTGAVLGAVALSIMILCITMVLFFIFSGIGMFILTAFSMVWSIVVIVMFPILFPLLVPIMILLILARFLLNNRQ